MYEQVLFYNQFGAGDVFESREFIKAWIKLVPAKRYCYSHGKSKRILLDIPEIEHKEFNQFMDSMRGVWDDLNGNLYVNTWIGRNSRYVLPGIGCTVEKLFEMHNEMLRTYNLGQLPGNPIDYIPDIDYSVYNIKKANAFVRRHSEEKIFIDNGLVQSMQAENFDFKEIICEVANNHKDKCFITTHLLNPSGDVLRANNVYNTDFIIGSLYGFDLPEVSYVSTFCSTLIGRNSGPHVFSQVKKNVMDETKKLLSFTYHPKGASFVVNTPVKIRKYWSSATKKDDVINKIEEVLAE